MIDIRNLIRVDEVLWKLETRKSQDSEERTGSSEEYEDEDEGARVLCWRCWVFQGPRS